MYLIKKVIFLGRFQVHLLEAAQDPSVQSIKAVTSADSSSSWEQLVRCQARLMGLSPPVVSRLDQLFLKPKLLSHLQLPQNKFQLSQLFQELMSLFTVYKDVYWSERTHQTGEELRLAFFAELRIHDGHNAVPYPPFLESPFQIFLFIL